MTGFCSFAVRLRAAAAAAALLLCALRSGAYLGVFGDFADLPPEASAKIAPLLAAGGADAVLLNMRGVRLGRYNWPRAARAWEDAGIRVFWDAPSTLAECDRIQGLGDGATLSGEPLDRGSGFLSQRWADEIRRTATAMAFELPRTPGFRVAAVRESSDPASGPDAAGSWRKFAERFFRDKSPSLDTNADHCTFNSSFQANYTSWEELGLFTEQDLKDPRKRRLRDMWLADAWADYVNGTCGSLYPLTGEKLNGPAAEALFEGWSDASLLASRRFVGGIWAGGGNGLAAVDCAAAAFGKRAIAASVSLEPGDARASLGRVLKMLPYARGLFLECKVSEAADSGPDEAVLGAPLEMISLLAPFVGRFVPNRADVLWIVPPDAETSEIVDAFCVSENTFALDPDCVDLSRFKAVIYLNDSPCVSTVIVQKLFDYAVKGGVVLLDACAIGRGRTLHGRENAPLWWEDITLERDSFGPGTTSVSLPGHPREFAMAREGTCPYVMGTPGKFAEIGEVTDSTGAKRPLLLVRSMGKSGKWVYINLPRAADCGDLIRAVVKSQAGVEMPGPRAARVYTGGSCALAVGPKDAVSVQIPCGFKDAVVFDPFAGAARVIRAENGALTVPGGLDKDGAMLWVVKPYGSPVALYADGVPGRAGSIEDGEFKDGVLTCSFSRRVYVSSPERPRSVVAGGVECAFEYDESSRLLTITRAGEGRVQAEIRY